MFDDLRPTPRYVWIARAYLCWLFGLLAGLTVLTHAAQLFGWSFQLYATAGATVTLIGTAAFVGAAIRWWKHAPPESDGLATALVVASMAAAALLALFSYRVDSDDYYYVPNAVHALENPTEPLDFVVKGLIPATSEPVISYNSGISLPFEFCQAILCYFAGIEYLTSYYFVMPMLVAAAMAAALFYAAGQFRLPPLPTVLGCAIALALLGLMGETHRSFGNFTVTRAFQGKALLLTAGLPFFVGATIEFFRGPSFLRWLLLAAIITAMVGATASALVILALFGPVLVLAVMAAQGRVVPLVRPVLLYAAAYLYLITYTLAYLSTGYHRKIGVSSPVNRYFPDGFDGHLWFMVNREVCVWPVIAIAAALVFGILAESRARLFVLTWIVSCIVFFLNPVTGPLLIEHVTSPNIYWRLFYLLPVTLLVALALAAVLRRTRHRQVLATALLLLAVAGHWVLPQASIYRIASLEAPRYDLPAAELAVARALVAHPVPRGPMLAPPTVGGIVPMLASGYPQLLRRDQTEQVWLGPDGDVQVLRRIGASSFAAGNLRGMRPFMETLATLPLQSIVLHPRSWHYLQTRGIAGQLQARGFGEPIIVAGFIVLSKDGT